MLQAILNVPLIFFMRQIIVVNQFFISSDSLLHTHTQMILQSIALLPQFILLFLEFSLYSSNILQLLSDQHQIFQPILMLIDWVGGGHHLKELASHHFQILVNCCLVCSPSRIHFLWTLKTIHDMYCFYLTVSINFINHHNLCCCLVQFEKKLHAE